MHAEGVSTQLTFHWFRPHAGASHLARMCLAVLLSAAPASGRAHDVTVAVDNTRGACRVRGAFEAPVSSAIAWDVLTDYDHIGNFVSSVLTSRVERGGDGQLRLRQEAMGSVFLFRHRVNVLLAIHEGHRCIAFRDLLGKDFRSYVGEWRLAADSMGTQVEYELEAEPRAALPRALCRGTLHRSAQALLEQVRAEMLRRGAQAAEPDSGLGRR